MMFKSMLGMMLIVILSAAPTSIAHSSEALTNQDVIAMVEAGLPESTILLSVRNSPHAFQTAPENLIALQKAGVPQAVMEAMLQRTSNAQPPGSPQTMPPTGAMAGMTPQGVVMLVGDQRIDLMRPMTGTRSKIRPGFLGLGSKHQQYAVITGAKAAVRISERLPQFEVTIPQGFYPEQMVKLVTLEVKRDTRESSTGAFQFGVSLEKPELDEDVVRTRLELVEGAVASPFGTLYRVAPSEPLPPGEYALVLMGQFHDFGVDPASPTPE